VEVLGKWGYGVASEKAQPCQFDLGRFMTVSRLKETREFDLKFIMLCRNFTTEEEENCCYKGVGC